MGQVNITLVRADTNQEFDVELPDDAAIAELLPALVRELGLPLTGPDGNQVAYELSSKRTGKEFKEKDTLGSGGAKGGDVLLLTSTFVAGRKPFALTSTVTIEDRTLRGRPVVVAVDADGDILIYGGGTPYAHRKDAYWIQVRGIRDALYWMAHLRDKRWFTHNVAHEIARALGDVLNR